MNVSKKFGCYRFLDLKNECLSKLHPAFYGEEMMIKEFVNIVIV